MYVVRYERTEAGQTILDSLEALVFDDLYNRNALYIIQHDIDGRLVLACLDRAYRIGIDFLISRN